MSFRANGSRLSFLQRLFGRGRASRRVEPARLHVESLENRELLAVDLAGAIFQDGDANGVQGTGEAGVAGAVIAVYNAGGDGLAGTGDDSLVAQQVVGADGLYSFTGLADATYYIQARPPVGDPYGSLAFTGDVNAMGRSATFSTSQADLDVGLVGALASPGWAVQIGGANYQLAHATATAADGSVYVAGVFQGTVDFDSGPGSYSLTSSNLDAYVAKYTAAGALEWVVRSSGTGSEEAVSVAVDQTGAVYVVGYFNGQGTFGSSSFNGTAINDAFVWKLSGAGESLWAGRSSGSGSEYAAGVAVDQTGAVYVVGYFDGQGTFGSSAFISSSNDAFVWKLSGAGESLWAVRSTGSGGEYAQAVAVDQTGAIYVVGLFGVAGAFGSTSFTAGGMDAFVWKLSGAGESLWAVRSSGSGSESAHSVTVDQTGAIYVAGHFGGQGTFGSSAFNAADYDAFVWKLSGAGESLWAVRSSGSGSESAHSVAMDQTGAVYVVGYFNGQGTFGSSFFDATNNDVFAWKLSATGESLWAGRSSGSGGEYAFGAAVDQTGAVYVAGYFYGQGTFGSASFNAESTGGYLWKVADFIPPTLTITSTAPSTVNGAIAVTVTLNEPSTDFTENDLVLGNTTISDFTAVSATEYTFTLTPTSDGTFSVSVAPGTFTDAVGNANTVGASLSRIADLTVPTITLETTASSTVNGAITVTVTLSESATDFTEADLTPTNGTISAFTAVSATEYTFTLTPTADGAFSVSVGAGAFSDHVGNANTIGASLSRTADLTAPTIALTSTAAATVNGPITVTVTLSEPSTNFTESDLVPTNGTIGDFTAVSATEYTFTLTPTATGEFSVEVGGDAFTDANGNANAAGASLSRTADLTAPTITLAADPATTVNGAITVTVTLSESATDFTDADLSPTNATISDFTAVSATEYTFTLTPTADGTFSVSVAAGVFNDAVGNANTVGASLSRIADLTAPTITLASDAPATVVGPLTVTVTLSEPSTDFTAADLALTNATISGFTGGGTTYTFTLAPSSAGEFVVAVAAGAFTDANGNANAVGASLSRIADLSAPTITILPTGEPAADGSMTFNVTLSSPATDFDAADLVATGATISDFSGSGVSYSFVLTPASVAPATVTVAAGSFSTAGGVFNAEGASLLVVIGGNGKDSVSFKTVKGATRVTVNKAKTTYTESFTQIVVAGRDGNDSVKADKSITTSMIVFGGAGNDVIASGAGNDILLGGAGNDTLKGGRGHNLMIGGLGEDSLKATTGSTTARDASIMIGDATTHDDDVAALSAIAAAWAAEDVATVRTYLDAGSVPGDGIADRIRSLKSVSDLIFSFEEILPGKRLDRLTVHATDVVN